MIDNSESFAAVKEMKDRAKLALDKAVEKLHGAGFNYQFVLCGLEGTTGSIEIRSLKRGSSSEAQMKTAVRQAADEIFAKAGAGSEKLFRSAKLCVDKLPSASKLPARAARGYLFVTDAPNCKDNDNKDALECNRSNESKPDHHRHLWAHSSGLGVSKHLSALGVLYRRTNGVCGNTDAIESPNSGESLTDNSQYAEAVKVAHGVLYPAGSGAPTGFGSLIGDVCASSYSVAPVEELVRVVQNLRSHRILLSRTPDSFPSHPIYNLTVKANGSTTSHAVRDGVVVATNGGSLQAIHHLKNNYDRTSFNLSAAPEPGSAVELYWGNTGSPRLSCPERADFGPYDCRWSGKSLHVRAIEVLPATEPVSTKSASFTAKYTKAVEKLKTLTFNTNDPVIGSTIAMSSYPAELTSRLAQMHVTVTNQGKSVTLQFGADDLPPGKYVVTFRSNVQRSFPHEVNLASGQSVRCMDVGADVSLVDGKIVISPPEAALDCQLSGKNIVFRGEGLNPITFKVALKTAVAPAGSFTLSQTPDDEIEVKTFDAKGEERPNSKFEMSGRKIIFQKALAPGERVEATYRRTPPQPGPDFRLLQQAVDGIYAVSLVRDGASEELAHGADFEIAAAEQGPVVLRLLRVVDPGATLVIRYTVLDETSELSEDLGLSHF